MLSDSPPERDLAWSEAGIEGAWRFVQRLWRLSAGAGGRSTWLGDGSDEALARKLHRTITSVAATHESLSLTKAVATLYDLVNTGEKAPRSASRGKSS